MLFNSIFKARCYAKVVYAVIVCLSVYLYIRDKSEFYKDD